MSHVQRVPDIAKPLIALVHERDMHWRFSQGCRLAAHHGSRVRELQREIEQRVAVIPCNCPCHQWPAEQRSLGLDRERELELSEAAAILGRAAHRGKLVTTPEPHHEGLFE